MSTSAIQTLPHRILGHWDTVFGVACVLVGLAGLRLVNDGGFWNRWVSGDDSGVPVGTLLRLNGEVRVRSASSFAWRELGTPAPLDVGGGDAVFTGPNSTAEVRLKDGATATLAPQSLIVLQVSQNTQDWWGDFLGTARDPSVLEVENGSLSVRLDQPGKRVKVKIQNKVFEVNAPQGAAQLALTHDQVTIVGGGSARLRELGTQETLALDGAGAGVRVNRSGKAVAVQEWVSPISPLQGQAVTLTPGQKLALQWRVLRPQTRIGFEWRPVNADGRPGAITKSAVAPAAGVASIEKEISSESRHYQWRLSGTDPRGEHLQSNWTDVWVARLVPPEIIGPRDDARLGDRIALRWEPTVPGLQTEIEVAPLDAPGKSKVHAGTRTGLELKLEPGHYLWKARTRDSAGNPSTWSKKRDLIIAPWDRRGSVALPIVASPPVAVAPAPAPALPVITPRRAVKIAPVTIAAPVEQIEILPTLENAEASANTRLGDQVILDRITVTLAWRPLPNIGQYTVSIFQANGSLVKTGKVVQPRFVVELRSLQENAYYYQVAATLPNGKEIKSGKAPIRVMLSPPVIRMPTSGKILPAGNAVLMTWEKTAITEKYELQISKDRDFKSLAVSHTQESNFYRFISGNNLGVHYWRVKSTSGKRESPWSEPATFTLQAQ